LGFTWFPYNYYDYPHYYSPYYYSYVPSYYDYYYYPPRRVYVASEPPAASSSAGTEPNNKRPDSNRPLPPSSVYKGSSGYPEDEPKPTPPPPPPKPSVQPMGVADVKALVKAGMADEVVISQITQSRVVFRLTTAEIIDLKESGVSNKLIDFMLNTARRR
jgi:hypothetical protein